MAGVLGTTSGGVRLLTDVVWVEGGGGCAMVWCLPLHRHSHVPPLVETVQALVSTSDGQPGTDQGADNTHGMPGASKAGSLPDFEVCLVSGSGAWDAPTWSVTFDVHDGLFSPQWSALTAGDSHAWYEPSWHRCTPSSPTPTWPSFLRSGQHAAAGAVGTPPETRTNMGLTKGLCQHGGRRSVCKKCGGRSICEHGRVRSRCISCGGSEMCEHGRRRVRCKECGGSSKCKACHGGSICEHGRERSKCKACHGGSICEHGRERHKCIDCGGNGICEHGRQRPNCLECGGTSICEHRRRRSRCRDCGGSGICKHGRQRGKCKDCGGSSLCKHGRERCRCSSCEGSGVCKHGRRRFSCKECIASTGVCDHGRRCSTCTICAAERRKDDDRGMVAKEEAQAGEEVGTEDSTECTSSDKVNPSSDEYDPSEHRSMDRIYAAAVAHERKKQHREAPMDPSSNDIAIPDARLCTLAQFESAILDRESLFSTLGGGGVTLDFP